MKISEKEYAQAVRQKDEADKIINAFHKQKAEQFKQRLESGKPFTDDDLVYSATAVCECGHGLAYPKDCGPGHYWDCSAILKGVAYPDLKHTAKLPFAFYDVKSENQPSANGATTRPTTCPTDL